MLGLVSEELQPKIASIWDKINQGQTLAQANNTDPNLLEALYTIGYQSFITRDFDNALQVFEILSITDHLCTRFRLALAGVHFEMEDYKQAMSQYSFALMLDETSVEAAYWVFRTTQMIDTYNSKSIGAAAFYVKKLIEKFHAEDKRYAKMSTEAKIYILKHNYKAPSELAREAEAARQAAENTE